MAEEAMIGSWTGGTATAGERLLLWSFRAWVSGPGFRDLVAREYARRFAPDEMPTALKALDLVVTAIARHARRRIVHHPPCCSRIAADEQAVLAIFAAAQAERADLALAHAGWLVRPDGAGAVVTAAAALGLAMIENDLCMPYRGITSPIADEAVPAEAVGRLH